MGYDIHFLAKPTLEFQSAQIFQVQPKNFRKPKIKILALESENYEVPPWDQFKRVIQEALMGMGEDHINSIIRTLERKVLHGHGLSKETRCGLSLLKQIIENLIPIYNLHMHCEAVFAVLLEAHHQAQLNSSTDTNKATELKTLVDNFKALDLVSQCNMFHSHFPRPCSSI